MTPSDPLEIYNCTFINNTAQVEGGAIKYTHSRPIMTDLIFNNNTARIYGGDTASYPIRIDTVNPHSNDLLKTFYPTPVSDLMSPTAYKIIDYDAQIVSTFENSIACIELSEKNQSSLNISTLQTCFPIIKGLF